MTKTKKKPAKRVLPADPEEQNDDRAAWARVAVGAFQNVTGMGEADGLDTAVMDLLADLAHLCDREGLKLEALLASAAHHYRAETDSSYFCISEDSDTMKENRPRGEQFDFLAEED